MPDLTPEGLRARAKSVAISCCMWHRGYTEEWRGRLATESLEACEECLAAAFTALVAEAARRVRELEEALHALTIWSQNGEQLCFRSHNNVPMGMSKTQERLARAALARRTP